MKKKNCLWIVLTGIASFFICCTGTDESSIAFDNISVEKTVSITKEADAPSCHVKLELAAAKKGKDSAAKAINDVLVQELFCMENLTLKQAADSFANSYTRSYVTNFAPLYREDRDDPAKRAWYEYHYYISSEMQSGKEGVTVYTTTLDYYEGGIHGINQRLVFNFDNNSGKHLKIQDIFVPGHEQQLNDLLLEKLLEKTGSKNVDELRNRGYLYSMDMFAPENFILGKNDITFIYNPYEIASYAMGMVELELTYDELENILKK